MTNLFTAKDRELFKSEIVRSIAPKIMKLIDNVNGRVDKLDGRVDNLEDKFQLMEVKFESLAEYNGRPTTINSRKTPSPKPKPIIKHKNTKSVSFRISPPTRKPPSPPHGSPPHGGQRKKNKTRKFRKSSH